MIGMDSDETLLESVSLEEALLLLGTSYNHDGYVDESTRG